MSRWDALRPTEEQPSTSGSSKGQRRTRDRRHGARGSSSVPSNSPAVVVEARGRYRRRGGRNDGEVRSKVDETQASKDKILLPGDSRASSGEIRRRIYNQTRLAYLNDRDNGDSLLAFANSVPPIFGLLPENVIIDEIVVGVFLPYLERGMDTGGYKSGAIDAPSQADLQILSTVRQMLADDRFSSSMMAALVDDVSDDGKEHQGVNPIRYRIFRLLQERISVGDGLTCFSASCEAACKTLTVALQTAYKLDRTKQHASLRTDVDANILRSFVVQSLERCTFCEPHLVTAISNTNVTVKELQVTLRLLLAYLKRHPETSPAFALSLLGGKPPQSNVLGKSASCSMCRVRDASSFLIVLHESPSTEDFEIAVGCLDIILQNIPLEKWVLKSMDTRDRKDILRSTLGFRDKIVSALRDTSKILICLLTNSKVHDSTFTLAKTSLLKVPFQNDPSLELLGLKLVCSLAEQVTNTSENSASDVLQAASGGIVTPEGNKTTMVPVFRSWLQTEEGVAFLVKLLSSLFTFPPLPGEESVSKLCNAILRSYPDPILVCGTGRLSIEIILDKLESIFHQRRLSTGLHLVNGLLLGRQEIGISSRYEDKSATVSYTLRIVRLLRLALEMGTVSAKKLACLGYSNLLACDWAVLAASTDEACLTHLELLLDISRCADSADLRAEGSKAVGYICTRLLSLWKDPEVAPVLPEAALSVSSTMVKCCEDTNSKVRCMAVFAIGNLAQALRDGSNTNFLNLEIQKKLTSVLKRGMVDDDEKVVANSIRSNGHLASLLAIGSSGFHTTEGVDSDLVSFLRGLMNDLVVFVCRSIPGNFRNKSANWKQRQATKKHSWGACNSLAMLLKLDFVRENLHTERQSAITVLVQCIEHLQDMNEKIVCAASAALRVLDSKEICEGLHGNDSWSNALLVCMSFVMGGTNDNGRLFTEIEKFLLFSFEVITVDVASSVLRSKRLSDSDLLLFCDWMDEKKLPLECFGTFAAAMREESVTIDISTEIRFTSRSIGEDERREDTEDADAEI